MRYLKPRGPLVELTSINKIDEKIIRENKRYHILFTLDVIDEIQDKTKMSINEILSMTTMSKYRMQSIEVLLKYVTGDAIEVKTDKLDYYSTLLLNTYIEQLKPKETTGGKKTNENEYPFVDVERWVYVGVTILHLPLDEVWGMTLGQLGTLEYKHAAYNGWIKDDKVENIDDVVPM